MTAVEWLEETSMRRNLVPGDFEQAKEMEKRKSKLEQLATLLQSAWTNGNWKAETPNEREMEKIMVELGYWNTPAGVSWGDKNDGGNPDNIMTMTWEEAMNGGLTVDAKTAGETTIQFPKAYQPEPYNPNRAALDTMTFKFEQDSNCVDGGEGETLIVEAKSSLGIDGDGGAFYVLRTEQWAVSDIDDIVRTLERVKAALDATKPTSIHVK